MIGASVQRRSSRQTSVPRPSGRRRSRMIASGGLQRRRAQRLLRGGRRRDLVAGAAQVRLQGAQELRLVVDDEDALAAHAGTSAGSSTAGRASTNDAPWPPRDSTQTRPSFASAKPRAIASPSPAPRWSGRPATRWNGSKIRSRSSSGIPGPAVGHPDEQLLPRRAHADVHRLVRRREPQRVLEQVDEHALDLNGVDAHGRELRPRRDDHALRRRPARRAPARRARRRSRAPAATRRRRPGAARGRGGCRRPA